MASFINNFTFSKTLDDLEYRVLSDGESSNLEELLNDTKQTGATKWSCSGKADIGDVCFFYYAKTALQHIRHVTRVFNVKTYNSIADHDAVDIALNRAEELYEIYGGKILAIGRVASLPEREEYPTRRYWADFDCLCILDNPVPLKDFDAIVSISKTNSITSLSEEQNARLIQLLERSNTSISDIDYSHFENVIVTHGADGKKVQFYTTRYERNQKLRKAAIDLRKRESDEISCCVCAFNFEKTYGERGRGFIEVHHLKPLSDRDEEVIVDPATDLACLCANCHRIIHRSGILTLEELRQLIN